MGRKVGDEHLRRNNRRGGQQRRRRRVVPGHPVHPGNIFSARRPENQPLPIGFRSNSPAGHHLQSGGQRGARRKPFVNPDHQSPQKRSDKEKRRSILRAYAPGNRRLPAEQRPGAPDRDRQTPAGILHLRAQGAQGRQQVILGSFSQGIRVGSNIGNLRQQQAQGEKQPENQPAVARVEFFYRPGGSPKTLNNQVFSLLADYSAQRAAAGLQRQGVIIGGRAQYPALAPRQSGKPDIAGGVIFGGRRGDTSFKRSCRSDQYLHFFVSPLT